MHVAKASLASLNVALQDVIQYSYFNIELYPFTYQAVTTCLHLGSNVSNTVP